MVRLRLEDAAQVDGHEGDVLACAFTPDSSCVLSAGWDGGLRLWDALRGAALDEIEVSNKPLSACAVSPDNKTWLIGTMDGLLASWDVESRLQISIFLAHTRPISRLVYSPDGSFLASSSWDRNVTVWETEDGLHGEPLGSHSDIVSGCCFTPDGKRLLSWSYDGTVKIWDVQQRLEVYQMQAHEDRITAGAVSPDGRWFLSGARNGEVMLWHLESGQPANAIPLQAEVRACFFLLDVESIVVVDANGKLTLHHVSTLQILDELDTRTSFQSAALAPSSGRLALGRADGGVSIVTVEGFDSTPLAVTAMQTLRVTSTMLQRMFGRTRIQPVFQCTCPACRASFELSHFDKAQPSSCPQCGRFLRVCAVADRPELVVG